MKNKKSLIVDKYVNQRWNPKAKKHYTSLGYKFTKYGDVFRIKPEHLTPTSKIFIHAKCESCLEVRRIRYDKFYKAKTGNCRNCASQKNRPLFYMNVLSEMIQAAGDDGKSMRDIIRELSLNGEVDVATLNTALTNLVNDGIVEKHSKYEHYFFVVNDSPVIYDDVVEARETREVTSNSNKESFFDKMLAKFGLKRI